MALPPSPCRCWSTVSRDRCDDEHSSLQEKFIHAFFKKYGFTAQSLPVLVNGESLDALLEIKGHLEDYLPEEGAHDQRARDYLWREVLWAIWGSASENSGGRVLKAAPEELKEKYRHVFA